MKKNLLLFTILISQLSTAVVSEADVAKSIDHGLIDAIKKNDLTRARKLVNLGKDVTVKDSNGFGIIQIAASTNNNEIYHFACDLVVKNTLSLCRNTTSSKAMEHASKSSGFHLSS